MEMLIERNAVVEVISRDVTGKGDPCYLAFKSAVTDKGWIPFSCSGNDNWSNIEGGETLGWEMALQLQAPISSLIIQVGGGALARAVSQALNEFYQLGLVKNLPKIYACQPEGGFPFIRAYYLVLKQIADRNSLPFALDYDLKGNPKTELQKIKLFTTNQHRQIKDTIEFVKNRFNEDAVQYTLRYVLKHRDDFMWAWDCGTPVSLARGILDDITYDWYYLLLNILKTGGKADILSEENIEEAYQLSRKYTRIPVSHSGAAGLAGLIRLEQSDAIKSSENVGLFFTGIDRNSRS
jgi:threonine synthase